jgi:DNA polymerase-3 subunit epsilon
MKRPDLPVYYRGNPEAGVAGVMRRKGYRVFFTENTLWHSLFGLLFWDELFESELLHSSFDWVPHCLKDRSFAGRFATQINDKLDAVRSGNALNLLLRPIAAKWGTPNGIFAWDHVDVDALRLLLSGTSGEGIATIVRSLCQNFRDMPDGFPISCWRRTVPSPSWRSRPKATLSGAINSHA